MFSRFSGKPLIGAFFLSLFLCLSSIVSAQNVISERSEEFDFQSEKAPKAPEIESKTMRAADSQYLKARGKFIQTDDFRGKIDSERAGFNENRQFGDLGKPETRSFTHHFLSEDVREKHLRLKSLLIESETASFRPPRRASGLDDNPKDAPPIEKGFQWRPAIRQSLIFLAVQHGYALTQPKTRESLKGKFFKDYAESVKSLKGWDDGGRFFTNYIAHPMQGSMTGFIYVQNDPKARRQQFGGSGDYWRSRLKAMAWSAAWSTQFEIGPISQASIGNVGLSGKQTWEDIVITPTLGTAMLIAEDAADRFITQRIERRTNNFYIRIFSRMLLSPTRIFANLLRFKVPWYRDRPLAR